MVVQRCMVIVAFAFAGVLVPSIAEGMESVEGEEHCVVFLEPIKPGQEASGASSPTCFTNFSDAIFFATSGTVRLPAAARGDALTDQLLREEATSSSAVVVGIDWADPYYQGSSYVFSTTAWSSGCAGNHAYGSYVMPAGWDNRVSSAKGYSSCRGVHYENTYYNGTIHYCAACATMGIMDNQTSSVIWQL